MKQGKLASIRCAIVVGERSRSTSWRRDRLPTQPPRSLVRSME